MAPVFGIEFSPLSQAELVDTLAKQRVPRGAGPRCVVTANLDHIVQLSRNPEFRSAYANAWVAVPDGTPVFVYAKFRGTAAPARLPGSDLFKALLSCLDPATERCFFVASGNDTAGRLRRFLRSRGFLDEAIDSAVPPHGFEQDASYSHALARRIRWHGTTHLFFGLGAPKSEIWIDRYRRELGDCYALSVGAGLDFFAGTKRRAPIWMQRAGMEWLWRASQEPRRLGRRYFVDSWRFLAAVRHDLLAHRS
jgi:N-acetylglucosaminyldiphosphoundecaprenol N-acetyl-beta-D-mannosaminyltransferase